MSILPVHYDCDPGQDDAVALLYALGSETLSVQSISVVGGNVHVEQCAKNALQILELAQRTDIPVYLGEAKPLYRKLEMLPQVFGVSGMAGAEDWPEPKADYKLLDSGKDLRRIVADKTLVATAPLTNIARQIQTDASFAASIKHLVIMGGCVYPEPIHKKIGNFHVKGSDDVAEYNFACDPEAAKIVFSAGIEQITLIGLDVTRSALYGEDIDTRLKALGGKCATGASQILSVVGEEDLEDYAAQRKSKTDPVRAMHDVLAMACAETPEMFTFEYLPLRIVAEAPPAAAGQSLIDANDADHPHVRVATKIDSARFLNQLVKNLKRLP